MPNAEWAQVPLARLHRHVFPEHASELASWGYLPRNANVFREVLIDSAVENQYIDKVWADVGYKYLFEVLLPTPSGDSMPAIVVWMIYQGTEYPTLVTVYPLEPHPVGRRRR